MAKVHYINAVDFGGGSGGGSDVDLSGYATKVYSDTGDNKVKDYVDAAIEEIEIPDVPELPDLVDLGPLGYSATRISEKNWAVWQGQSKPIEDSGGIVGWGFKNEGNGDKIHWKLWDQSRQAPKILRLGDVLSYSFIISGRGQCPFLHVYTVKKMDGQDAANTYRSRLTYLMTDPFPADLIGRAHVTSNANTLTFSNLRRLELILNDVRAVAEDQLEVQPAATVGPGEPDEEIKEIVVSTNSTAAAGAYDFTLANMIVHSKHGTFNTELEFDAPDEGYVTDEQLEAVDERLKVVEFDYTTTDELNAVNSRVTKNKQDIAELQEGYATVEYSDEGDQALWTGLNDLQTEVRTNSYRVSTVLDDESVGECVFSNPGAEYTSQDSITFSERDLSGHSIHWSLIKPGWAFTITEKDSDNYAVGEIKSINPGNNTAQIQILDGEGSPTFGDILHFSGSPYAPMSHEEPPEYATVAYSDEQDSEVLKAANNYTNEAVLALDTAGVDPAADYDWTGHHKYTGGEVEINNTYGPVTYHGAMSDYSGENRNSWMKFRLNANSEYYCHFGPTNSYWEMRWTLNTATMSWAQTHTSEKVVTIDKYGLKVKGSSVTRNATMLQALKGTNDFASLKAKLIELLEAEVASYEVDEKSC